MKSLSNIKIYEGGASNIPGKRKVIKMSSNESPFGPSPNVVSKIRETIRKTNRYPDGEYKKLKKAISTKFNLPESNLFCGNGSDEILGIACQLFLKKGDEVIIPKHSFLMFEIYSKINGGIVKTSRTTKLRFQVEDILNKINSKTKIIFLAQPNNPTGFYLNKKELSKLVKKVPKKIIIILDAAYAEYMTDNEYSTGIDYAKKNKNIIVTRTFSKIYGIASLRLGWCYAHRDIINLMNKIRGPFNVNHVAQEAGIAALRDKKYQLKAIKHNKYWLEKMKFKLSQLPIYVHDSRANFLLLDVGKNASKLNRFLLSKSIIVRTMEKYGLKSCIRVSIGKSRENIKLLDVMDRFYK
tara:strand:+ start:2323 stop:3381 length:1059 start_codon:yes stop_codon:yes gene_type:complete